MSTAAVLNLKRDKDDFKYLVNVHYKSSLSGLYIEGPLNTGPDQAIIDNGGLSHKSLTYTLY